MALLRLFKGKDTKTKDFSIKHIKVQNDVTFSHCENQEEFQILEKTKTISLKKLNIYYPKSTENALQRGSFKFI